MVVVIIALLLIGFTEPALAGIRPSSVEDSGTVPPGKVEPKIGMDYTSSGEDETAILGTVTTGILENLDIGMDIPVIFLHDADEEGLGDMALLLKYRFFEETDDFPELMINPVIKFDTGDEAKGLGSGENDYLINLVAGKHFEKFSVFMNLGYNFVGGPDDDALSYGLALYYNLSPKFQLVGDITGRNGLGSQKDDDPLAILGGLRYEIFEHLWWDFGTSLGIASESKDYILKTGLTFEFGI